MLSEKSAGHEKYPHFLEKQVHLQKAILNLQPINFFFVSAAKSQGSLEPRRFSVADSFFLKQEEFQCHIISQAPKVKPRSFVLVLIPCFSIHNHFSHLTCPLCFHIPQPCQWMSSILFSSPRGIFFPC